MYNLYNRQYDVYVCMCNYMCIRIIYDIYVYVYTRNLPNKSLGVRQRCA